MEALFCLIKYSLDTNVVSLATRVTFRKIEIMPNMVFFHLPCPSDDNALVVGERLP